MSRWLLKNGKIFNGENFIDGDLLITDGEISALGVVQTTDAQELDCFGCIISAGLVDIHSHLSEMGSVQFGFPADMATIPFGVAYAADACAEDTNVSYLNNICVQTAVFIPFLANGNTLDFQAMERKIQLYGDRVVGVKMYYDESLQNGIMREHLLSACDFAKARKLKVMVHCSNSATSMLDIVNILGAGDILTHSYHGGVHTIEENNYEAYKKAKEKGVIIDAGMAGGVHTDFEVLRKAIANGCIPDTISSDITKFSAYIRGGVYGLPMCMSLMKYLGMEESKIFQAVTTNAAKAVGKEKDWSIMEVGKSATVSVLQYTDVDIDITDRAGNRIVSKQGYICKATIKNGQIIYRK